MENPLKPLFFNETLKRWRFEELVKASGKSRERAGHFTRQLLKGGFIARVKQRRRMPYYIAKRDSPGFRAEKRLYGLAMLEQSGLLAHIAAIGEIKTAIIFGSFSSGNWHKDSDIDLFIYGDDRSLNKALFERKIKREIQLFSFRNAKEVKKQLDPALLPNIARGFSIKESMEPFEVRVNA